MPNVRSLLAGDRFGPATVDARCRPGRDQCRSDHNGQVQRSRRRQLGQRTQPRTRQPRRARRERVEIKHDERSRKAGTEGTRSKASTNSAQSTVALPRFIAPAPRHHGTRGEISRRFRKISQQVSGRRPRRALPTGVERSRHQDCAGGAGFKTSGSERADRQRRRRGVPASAARGHRTGRLAVSSGTHASFYRTRSRRRRQRTRLDR